MAKGKRISDYVSTFDFSSTQQVDDSILGKDLKVINWEIVEGRFGEVAIIYTNDDKAIRTSSQVVINKLKQLNKEEIEFPLIVQFVKITSSTGRSYYDVV